MFSTSQFYPAPFFTALLLLSFQFFGVALFKKSTQLNKKAFPAPPSSSYHHSAALKEAAAAAAMNVC